MSEGVSDTSLLSLILQRGKLQISFFRLVVLGLSIAGMQFLWLLWGTREGKQRKKLRKWIFPFISDLEGLWVWNVVANIVRPKQ